MGMHGRRVAIWTAVILIGGALFAPPVPASTGIRERLADAESIRSNDPQALRALLDGLNREAHLATPAEAEHLAFLNAYYAAYIGNFEEAIHSAERLYGSSADPEIRFRSASLILNSAAGIRDFTTGFRYLRPLLDASPSISNDTLRHQGLATASVLLNQVGEYKDGLHYAQLILDEGPTGGMQCTAGYLRVEAQIALAPGAANDGELAAVADDCRKSGNLVVAHFGQFQRARLRSINGDAASARQLLVDDLEAVESTRYPRLIIEVQSLLAQLNFTLGDPQAAAVHAERAVAAGRGARYSAPVVESLRVLADVAKQRGDSAEALRRMGEFAEAQRGYLDEVRSRELAVQLARHQTLQQAQSLELLERQNQLLRLQQDVGQQRQTIFLLALALLAVLLGFVVYWALRVKRLQLSFQRLAETDGLTGLANRAHFTAQCERRLAAANAAGRRLAVVLFDLDHFKQVNDVHGHPSGDAVLRAVGEAIRGALRPGMQAGRMGGEEFGIVLDADDLPAAEADIEACRAAIATVAVPLEAAVLRITASFGMARSHPNRREFKALLIAADAALYAAKASGRNRVCLAPEAEAEAAPTSIAPAPHPSPGPQGTLHG